MQASYEQLDKAVKDAAVAAMQNCSVRISWIDQLIKDGSGLRQLATVIASENLQNFPCDTPIEDISVSFSIDGEYFSVDFYVRGVYLLCVYWKMREAAVGAVESSLVGQQEVTIRYLSENVECDPRFANPHTCQSWEYALWAIKSTLSVDDISGMSEDQLDALFVALDAIYEELRK